MSDIFKIVATTEGFFTMPTRQPETHAQERARLINEIVAHDEVGYPSGSPQQKNHRKTLQGRKIAYLREIVSHYAESGKKTA